VTKLSAFGISLDVPPGWEARAFAHPGGEPTIHLASFPLPHTDGDFGTTATAAMPVDSLFLALTEYALSPAELERGLFAHEPPTRLGMEHLSERALIRPAPDQLGLQRFFSASGRGFCLYVVARSAGKPRMHALNDVLASLDYGARPAASTART
jgi:hypothetical protein